LRAQFDLDSAEATVVHSRLIREKHFLRKLYCHYYEQYDAVRAFATPGRLVLEIGAGEDSIVRSPRKCDHSMS
jgi:hypothetical protein